MGEGFDQHLGGNDFDMILFNIFVEKFNALPER
jgi:molecular chaperone DnaK (HSP70)